MTATAPLRRLPPRPTIAVVVPVHDNASTLRELHRRTVDALEPLSGRLEMWYVDDASTDGSWAVVRSLADDPRVGGLRLAHNVGALSARAVGCSYTESEVVCTLDADLENSPEDLPVLVDLLIDGHDLVSAVRVDQRGRPLGRRFATRATRTVVSRRWSFAPRDFGCGLKAWRAEVGRRAGADAQHARDVQWAIALFDAVTAYGEVEVAWNDRHRRSSYGWCKKLAQAGLLLRSLSARSSLAAAAAPGLDAGPVVSQRCGRGAAFGDAES